MQAVEERQGLKIACVEEVAYHCGFFNETQLRQLADHCAAAYGDYLRGVLRTSGGNSNYLQFDGPDSLKQSWVSLRIDAVHGQETTGRWLSGMEGAAME